MLLGLGCPGLKYPGFEVVILCSEAQCSYDYVGKIMREAHPEFPLRVCPTRRQQHIVLSLRGKIM